MGSGVSLTLYQINIWQNAIKKVVFQRAGLTTRCCKPAKFQNDFVCFPKILHEYFLHTSCIPSGCGSNVFLVILSFVMPALVCVCIYPPTSLERRACETTPQACHPASASPPTSQTSLPGKPALQTVRQAFQTTLQVASQASLPDHHQVSKLKKD